MYLNIVGMDGFLLDGSRLAQERARGVWPGRVITDDLDRWLLEKPDACALIGWREESQSCVRLSYLELAQRAARAARLLAGAGIGRGDVVSFQLPNWWEFVAVHLACVRLGAVSNPLITCVILAACRACAPRAARRCPRA